MFASLLLGKKSSRRRTYRHCSSRYLGVKQRRARMMRCELLEPRAMLAVSVAINDVSVVEGDAGTTDLVFTVTRTGDAVPFTVDYSTTNDTASAALSGAAPEFTRHTIGATVDDPQDLVTADIDSDGDLDVLSASYYDDTIAWYENDGSGNFTAHTISTTANSPIAASAADLDGDGDTDVIAAWWSPDTLAWYENDGHENFSLHTIEVFGDYPYGIQSIYAVDVDGDLDTDILTADQGVDTVTWYENDGVGNFASHVVTNTADGARDVIAADMDGDSDIDILTASAVDDTVAWFENDGSQNFTSHTITNTADFVVAVSAADIDGDGDMDVLSASYLDKTSAWYENDGAQHFTEQVISNDLYGAYSVSPNDIDQDGDIDVLFTAAPSRGIAWLENDGAENFSLHVIASIWSATNSALAADVDGDGDADVLTNLRLNDTVAWFENSLVNPEPADYLPASGTLSFAANETSKTIIVTVLGDTTIEPDEAFYVTLANATTDVTISDSRGFGTILNDDVSPTTFYVVDDASANRTYEYQASGAANENYALYSSNSAPRGVASTAAGDKVWIVDANRKVYVYSTSGGLLGSWTAGTLASNATPEGIATNGTDVWIVDSKSDKVYRYAGAASRLSGSQNAASSFSLNSGNKDAKDIVTDGASLWVVNDSTTDKVFKYTVAGSLLGSWKLDSINSKPTGITIDPAYVSDIWIVDSGKDHVYQYSAAAGRTSGIQAASAWFALAAGNANPQGIADPPQGRGSIISQAIVAELPLSSPASVPIARSSQAPGVKTRTQIVRERALEAYRFDWWDRPKIRETLARTIGDYFGGLEDEEQSSCDCEVVVGQPERGDFDAWDMRLRLT